MSETGAQRSDEPGAATPGSVRRAQRIASQLHQLVATSIATSGVADEERILAAVASRARTLLDCEEALVRVEGSGGLGALARRGAPTRVVGSEQDDWPRLEEIGEGPRTVREWMTAPVLQAWNQPLGLIAVRGLASDATSDDEEILSLLAQMTASALAETRLRDGVRASEARWRALVDSAPIGIVEVHADGSAQWWNRAAATTLGWPEPAAGGTSHPPSWISGLDEQLAPLWRDASHDVARGDVVLERDGRRRELRVSVSSLGTSSGGASLLTLLDDVTDEREMLAELRQARGGEIRAQMASSVAHDFNNLLTLITGYTELLEHSVGDAAVELVREIQATTRRAAQITQQLQTIGRTQAREAKVVDVRRVIESNAEVIERIVGPHVLVERELDPGAGNVMVDADQFEQMILNLVINARDAMPDGGTLRLSVSSGEGPSVVTRVADTGSGMDEQTLARCFEPFFTTKGPFKGTGVGLAAARRLMEASAGTIVAESALGAGTTFTITLPATDQAAASDVLETVRVSASGSLLVAEDDDVLRRLMVQVLRRAGYRVLEADNGESALVAAADEELDALVSDVDMPLLGGIELALTLQARRPALPVLLVSGHADASTTSELTPGTSDFLAKPFRPSELADRVNALLVRARRA